VADRLPFAGASVTSLTSVSSSQATGSRASARRLSPAAAVVAVLLPLVGANAQAETVAAGSTVNNSVVNNGATQTVKGTANTTTINDGGIQAVSKGGLATAAVVNDGGIQRVFSGGTATSTVIMSGGSAGVSKGGLATDAIVSSGGIQRVYSGGSAAGTTVAGGKQYVSKGGAATGTVVSGGSQVVFNGASANATVVASGGTMIVSSGGAATSSLVATGGQATVLLGGSVEQASVAAGGTMTVNVGGMTKDGVVAATPVQGIAVAGQLNIAEESDDGLTGAAAATLDTLSMKGGTVALGAPGSGGFKTVTVNGLSGSGQFVLNTNVGAQQADQLVVDHASGAFTLAVHDSSTTPPVSPNERLLLVKTTDSTATFSLPDNALDVGAYKFGLQDVDGQYYFYNTGGKSDVASVAGAAQTLPALLWNVQADQTFGHLADYRGGTLDGQLWVRGFDQRLRTNPGGVDATTDFYGAQIGRDWRIATRGGSWYVGVTGGFAQANETFDSLGGGTARPWNLGAYTGYDDASGLFADAIVRYTGSRQNLDVTTPANQASAEYSQTGYAVSFDAGKRLKLAGRWWIEPRAALTYQHTGDSHYTTTLGTPVMLASSNLVFGDAGVALGASLAVGEQTLEPFVRVGATHLFGADPVNTIGGTTLSGSLPRTWATASAGVSAVLSTHVRAFTAFSYGKGSDYTQPWAVTLGLSFTE
jgi:outer membrane autotransporter protein